MSFVLVISLLVLGAGATVVNVADASVGVILAVVCLVCLALSGLALVFR